MPIQVSCPSCGAPVRFQSAGSAVAVCAYCHSTLAREGGAPVGLEGRRAAATGGVHPVLVGVDEFEVRLLRDGLGGVEQGVG